MKSKVIYCLYVICWLIFIVAEQTTGIAANNGDGPDPQASSQHRVDNIVRTDDVPSASKGTKSDRVWISRLFDQGKDTFDVHPNVSSQCKSSFDLYTLHLRNQTVWAIRIMESSDWPINQLLIAANIRRTGDWDGCIQAKGPSPLKGKYCIVTSQIQINVSHHGQPLHQRSNDDSSAWDVVEMYADDLRHVDRRKIEWALCIPSLCSANEVEMSLEYTLRPIFQKYSFDIQVDVDPKLCSVEDYHRPSAGYYYTCATFVLIILLVVLSSLYDVSRNNEEKEGDTRSSFWKQLLICFSVKQSIHSLIHYSSITTTNPGMYMIKVIYLCFIIIGHRLYSLSLMFPSSSAEEVEMIYESNRVSKVLLDVVDVFFMISGFLTVYLGYAATKKAGFTYFILSLVFRWLRLMPVFGLTLLFFINIFPYTGEGPAWSHIVQPEVENCRETWWSIMSALSNVVKAEKQCLPVSWYLSVDIQLHILGGILLLIITKYRRIGWCCFLLAFLVPSLLVGIMVYQERYHAILLTWIRTLNSIKNTEEFYKLYISTCSRVGPYLVGFGAALMALRLKERKYKFSGIWTAIIVLGCGILGRTVQYHSFVFYDQSRSFNVLEHAIYAVVHRPLFVLPLASILCIYFTSGLGKLNAVFEMKIFIPLGRLVYSVFVIHFMVQLYHVSSARGLILTPFAINQIVFALFDISASFTLGVFLYMISEGPLCSLTKLLRRYATSDTKPASHDLQDIPENGIQNEAFDEQKHM